MNQVEQTIDVSIDQDQSNYEETYKINQNIQIDDLISFANLRLSEQGTVHNLKLLKRKTQIEDLEISHRSFDQDDSLINQVKVAQPRQYFFEVVRQVIQDNRNQDIISKGQILCEICYKRLSALQQLSLNCGHTFCKGCLEEMIIYAINVSGEVHKLKCPDYNCQAVLSREVIKNLTNKNQFSKYLGLQQNYDLINNKNKKFCPIPDCKNVLERNRLIINTKVKCSKCEKNVCFDCQSIWHQGKSCRQYQREIINSLSLNKDAQKCPKCKVVIEKNEGCIHMLCYKCQHHFCWGCGFPVDHIIHDDEIQKYLFYGICTNGKYQTISIKKLMGVYTLLAIAIQIICFFLFFIGGALFWIGYGPYCLYRDIIEDYKGPLVKKIVIYLFVVGFPACLIIGLITGVLLGLFYLVLGIIPIGILHSYHLIKIISWRKQGKRFRGQ